MQEPRGSLEQDQYWMDQAIALAREAFTLGEVPIGAVIVKDGRLVGKGYNRRELDQNALAHAEMLAIHEACQTLGGWRLTGCELYVTLEPCPMCAGAIVQARLSRVIYGAADPKGGYAGSLYNTLADSRLNHQVAWTAGVRQNECETLLKTFFKVLREKKGNKGAHRAENSSGSF